MIHEEKCYCVTCDNCGETYMNEHSGFSLFVDENQCYENIDNDSWFTHGEGEHTDKHYCEKCYKYDEVDEDKIILNESRKKLNSEPEVQASVATEVDSSTEDDKQKIIALTASLTNTEKEREYWKLLAEGYIKLLKIADCPEILLENPHILFATTPNTEDLNWAEGVVKKYKTQTPNT